MCSSGSNTAKVGRWRGCKNRLNRDHAEPDSGMLRAVGIFSDQDGGRCSRSMGRQTHFGRRRNRSNDAFASSEKLVGGPSLKPANTSRASGVSASSSDSIARIALGSAG